MILTLGASDQKPQPKPAQTQERGQPQSQDAGHGPTTLYVAPAPLSQQEAAQQEAERGEKRRNDWNMVALTGVLAGVGFLQLVVFGYQALKLRETVRDGEKAIAAAQTSANSAADAARAARDTIETMEKIADRELRAYVHAHRLTIRQLPTGELYVMIKVKNTGQTPATFFEIGAVAEMLHPSAAAKAKPTNISKFNGWSALGAGCSKTAMLYAEGLDNIKTADFSDTNILSVCGKIRYSDISDVFYESEFSYFCRNVLAGAVPLKMSHVPGKLHVYERAQHQQPLNPN